MTETRKRTLISPTVGPVDDRSDWTSDWGELTHAQSLWVTGTLIGPDPSIAHRVMRREAEFPPHVAEYQTKLDAEAEAERLAREADGHRPNFRRRQKMKAKELEYPGYWPFDIDDVFTVRQLDRQQSNYFYSEMYAHAQRRALTLGLVDNNYKPGTPDHSLEDTIAMIRGEVPLTRRARWCCYREDEQ